MTTRYGTGARLFHWLVVLLLLAQVPAGITMVVPAMLGDFPALPGVEQSTIDALYVFHKGLGAILIVVIVLRILWRLTHTPPPLPDSMPPLERKLVRRTEAGMYVLMVIVGVTGYVHVIGLGFPIELLDWVGVPPLLPKVERLAVISSFVHRFAVFALLGTIAVHIAEVLRHHWIVKDGILGRMWPPFGGRDEPAPPTAPQR
ncbi:MAG: cytochrome b [Gemmatimonadetes bacterium]|nr:cytochrome b [Gemmatimonadota bacterium]